MNTAPNLHHVNAWENKVSTERSTSKRGPIVRSTGLPQLDAILPYGGWPKGAVVEVIVPDTFCDSIRFLLPTLEQLGAEGRWLGLQALSYSQSLAISSNHDIDQSRIMQVNQHPGRSGLWTLEQMLRSGTFSAVVAWPECSTDLMVKRLQKAAMIGKSMAFLFSTAGATQPYSRNDLRIRIDLCDEVMTAVMVDYEGEQISETAIIG